MGTDSGGFGFPACRRCGLCACWHHGLKLPLIVDALMQTFVGTRELSAWLSVSAIDNQLSVRRRRTELMYDDPQRRRVDDFGLAETLLKKETPKKK
jgi:hypothetical protein